MFELLEYVVLDLSASGLKNIQFQVDLEGVEYHLSLYIASNKSQKTYRLMAYEDGVFGAWEVPFQRDQYEPITDEEILLYVKMVISILILSPSPMESLAALGTWIWRWCD